MGHKTVNECYSAQQNVIPNYRGFWEGMANQAVAMQMREPGAEILEYNPLAHWRQP